MRIPSFLKAVAILAVALGTPALARAQYVTELRVTPLCSQSAAVDVTIDLTTSAAPVAGGQFFLSFDTARLQYLGATPGPSFPTVVYSASDGLGGTIDYAVSTALGAPMVPAPARFATLHFTALTQICAGDNLTLVSFRPRPSPLPPTRLTDTAGAPIPTTAVDLAPFTVDSVIPGIATLPPINASTNAFDCFATVSLTPPAATDNCGPTTVAGVRDDSQPLASPFPLGPTTITWTATDCAGNTNSSMQVVTVADNTPPVIGDCGVNLNAPGNLSCQAPLPDFTAAVMATDNCTATGSLVVTQSPPAGTLVGPAPTTVTITVRDAANNPSTCQRTFTIDPVAPPTATAAATGGSSVICSTGVVQLTGTATNYASVQWSGGSGSFNNPNILNPIYTPGPGDALAGSVVLTLTAYSPYSCVPPATATVTITVNSAPIAPTSAGVNTNNFCTGTVPSITLSAAGGSGTILVWRVGSCTGPVIGPGSPLTIGAPPTTTTFFAQWVNACGPSACASITVTVVQRPTASAGPPQVVCANGVAQLNGVATDYSSVHWSGGGGFSNPNILNPLYTPTPADISAGSVTLTLTVQPSAPCTGQPPAVSTVTLTILNVPTAPTSASSSPASACAGVTSSITLTASGGTGLILNWYSGSCGGVFIDSGPSITIPAPLTTTTYFARWTNKCGSSTCASVVVPVSAPPTPPTSITTSDDNYCNGSVSTILLTALGGVGTGTEWFTDGCGVTPVGSTNPLSIPAPSVTTTFYARRTNPPCAPSACTPITITVNPTTGACCTAYGTLKMCTVVPPINCTGPTTPSHVYRGDCTTCGPTVCCPADYNNNGTLEVADIFAFINDWFAQAPSADFNNNSTFQVQDIFDMLNAWFAGC